MSKESLQGKDLADFAHRIRIAIAIRLASGRGTR
jgi:hypothetical protein